MGTLKKVSVVRKGNAKQEELIFRLSSRDISDDLIIARCANLRQAVRLCRDCSPLSDDEIVYALERDYGIKIQRSHFVEALNGGPRNLPAEAIQPLEDLCGNDIPTRYMALSRRCELKPKQEKWEIENEQLRAALQQERSEREAIIDFLRRSGLRI